MKKFGELEGYNSIIEYNNIILDFIKNLGNKKVEKSNFNSIADSKYEYTNAKIIIDEILELIKDIKMESSSNLSTEDKEQVFRNCLAHGRYTLA